MTYEEALKELKHEIDMLPNEPPSDFVGNENVWLKEHKKIINAHKIAIKAIEKQIVKKPIEDGYYDEPAVCPNCGGNIINMADNDYHFQHCHYCGQAIDWGE